MNETRKTDMSIHEDFLGLAIKVGTFTETVGELLSMATGPHAATDVHLINAYNVALRKFDKSYRRCLDTASILLADGRPISVVSRLWGGQIEQHRGPSIFEEVISRGRSMGVRHYLLGSTEHTLSELTSALEREYPGSIIAGSYSPPFRPMSSAEMACQDERIASVKPDIIWVGLGTPKQDYEGQRLAASLGVLTIAVGAAFDFSAGTKPVCPDVVRRYGLEWLYRLASEPKRLWRRYLIGNAVFIALVLAETPARLVARNGLLRRKVDAAICTSINHHRPWTAAAVKVRNNRRS